MRRNVQSTFHPTPPSEKCTKNTVFTEGGPSSLIVRVDISMYATTHQGRPMVCSGKARWTLWMCAHGAPSVSCGRNVVPTHAFIVLVMTHVGNKIYFAMLSATVSQEIKLKPKLTSILNLMVMTHMMMKNWTQMMKTTTSSHSRMIRSLMKFPRTF
jgi:hypothetical protein